MHDFGIGVHFTSSSLLLRSTLQPALFHLSAHRLQGQMTQPLASPGQHTQHKITLELLAGNYNLQY